MSTHPKLPDKPDSTQTQPSIDTKAWPEYLLNANSLLQQPLLPLCKGKDILETIAKGPTVLRHYTGQLAEWDKFKQTQLSTSKSSQLFVILQASQA